MLDVTDGHGLEKLLRFVMQIPCFYFYCYAYGEFPVDSCLLVFIYPTQKGDFGWSRVGWGFGQWWPQCKKYTKILPEPLEALKIVVNIWKRQDRNQQNRNNL